MLFGACVVGAVALIVALAVPLVLSCGLIFRFQNYKQDLATSFSYGEEHDSMFVTLGDERTLVSDDRAKRLFSVIVDTGMGKPADVLPDEGGLLIEFGDGSTLEIWSVEITEGGRVSDTGVLISYRRSDGQTFSYDTDYLQYEDVLRILGLA